MPAAPTKPFPSQTRPCLRAAISCFTPKAMSPAPFILALRLVAGAALCLVFVPLHAAEASRAPCNGVFIAINDMNDCAGAFGGAPQNRSATPKMDPWAQSGSVVFQAANCAGPVCSLSRSALLSGFRPHRSGVSTNSQNTLGSPLIKNPLTLPEGFSPQGYRPLSHGKLFPKHPGDEGHWTYDQGEPAEGGSGSRPDPDRVTSRNRSLMAGKPAPVPAGKGGGDEGGEAAGPEFAWGPTRGPKENSKDWKAAEWAVAQWSKPSPKPFFLALGLSTPHLRWYVPQEYLDRHAVDTLQVPEFRLKDLDDIVDAKGRGKFRPSSGFPWAQQGPRLLKRAVRADRGSDFIDVGAQISRTFKLKNQRQGEVRRDVAHLLAFDKPLPQLADTDDFAVCGQAGQMRIRRWALQRPRNYPLTVAV